MRGDRLIVKPYHRRVAGELVDRIGPLSRSDVGRPLILTVGGESGSGKSEIAQALSDEMSTRGLTAVILQQDDYFAYPPATNDRRRREEIERVGLSEVRLDLLTAHIEQIVRGTRRLSVPLVDYAMDRIETQAIDLAGIAFVLIEGTYTTLLEPVDLHIYLEGTAEQTRSNRLERARELQDEFIERVLQIEHAIIGPHRERAHLVVTSDFRVIEGPSFIRADLRTTTDGDLQEVM